LSKNSTSNGKAGRVASAKTPADSIGVLVIDDQAVVRVG
jgi:hypothetical protein